MSFVLYYSAFLHCILNSPCRIKGIEKSILLMLKVIYLHFYVEFTCRLYLQNIQLMR